MRILIAFLILCDECHEPRIRALTFALPLTIIATVFHSTENALSESNLEQENILGSFKTTAFFLT